MPQPAAYRALGPFQARPLTSATWPDLEKLFGLPGGSIVRGVVPGLVGYAGGSPVGWMSLGTREDYLKLRRSPIMKPVDDTRVWSVVCTYVARPYRGLDSPGLIVRNGASGLDSSR